MELYKPELLTKPAILVLNKVDQESDGVVVSEVLEQLTSRAAPIPHTLPAELLPKQPPVFDDVSHLFVFLTFLKFLILLKLKGMENALYIYENYHY